MHADFYHHLRNVWANVVIKVIDNRFRLKLSEDLRALDSHLRVKINMNDIVMSQDKLFSLTRNYLKVHVCAFHSHMEECGPNSLLMPVPSLKGNRQDAVL